MIDNVKQFVSISVVIPTFGRDKVLIDTIGQFLEQKPAAKEVLVVDQTPVHDNLTELQLKSWHGAGAIRWLRLDRPSQPGALNRALREASQPVVLFLDDDIRIDQGFVAAHARHYDDEDIWAVAGQVLQPGQEELTGWERRPGSGPFVDWDFPFHSDRQCYIENGMSGNLSVRRDKALAVGGFDENFLPPVSYRFDNEFCKRLCRAGGRILFEPRARIYHLRCSRGGTRTRGSHLTSASPMHGAGDYYFCLCQGWSLATVRYFLRRPFREVCTRFHLRHPWWIPVKFFGELRAMFQAIGLHLQGAKTLRPRDERLETKD